MTETVAGRLHFDFRPFLNQTKRAGEMIERSGRPIKLSTLGRGSTTIGDILWWLDLCDGVSRVNFWPEHTVTVWMTWDPRPTREQIQQVSFTLNLILPVPIRVRIMAVPGKPTPPQPISTWDQYQRDIDRMVICGT